MTSSLMHTLLFHPHALTHDGIERQRTYGIRSIGCWMCVWITLHMAFIPCLFATDVYPGKTWSQQTPKQAGLEKSKLDAVAHYLEGRGYITRNGIMVYEWGDASKRGDIASAAKPFYSHLLFNAVEENKLPDLNTLVADFVPELKTLNPDLGHKDKSITFRHLANQISCYGVKEDPGSAFDYNDWQMALFWDALFLKVYQSDLDRVDRDVFHAKLTDPIQCQDEPTFLAFGKKDRAGRVGISPRDFCRFGLLYLRQGKWKDQQILPSAVIYKATHKPLAPEFPRTSASEAEMLPGKRSIGSRNIPDDQTDHMGSYSWLWWINGTNAKGKRLWPDAPDEVWTCLGHKNGKRGMAVIPELDIVMSWNDTKLDSMKEHPHPLNEVFKLIKESVMKNANP